MRSWHFLSRVAVVAAIVWLGVGLLLGWRALGDQVDSFARVPMPGQAELRFERPGGYVVYLEGEATRRLGFSPAFGVTLTDSDGTEVPVSRYGLATPYNLGGHTGSAIGTFTIDRPGSYVLQAQRLGDGPPANLAVGRGLRPAIVRALATAFALPVLVLVAGTAMALSRAARRRQARRGPSQAPPEPAPEADPSGEPEVIG
jgi:hypothetical protein